MDSHILSGPSSSMLLTKKKRKEKNRRKILRFQTYPKVNRRSLLIYHDLCDIFILATCFMRIFTDQKSMYDGIDRNAKFNPNLARVLSFSYMCRSHRLGGGVDEVWFQNLFWRIFQPKQKFNQYAISYV